MTTGSIGGGAAAVPGANQQVIYNDSGVLAGDSGLTYNKATDGLTVVGPITSNGNYLMDKAAPSLTLRSSDSSNAQVSMYDPTDGGWAWFIQDGYLYLARMDTSGNWTRSVISMNPNGDVFQLLGPTGAPVQIYLNPVAGQDANIYFLEGGTSKWVVMSQNSFDDRFIVYNAVLGRQELAMATAGGATFASLAGSGNRMVQANSSGTLSATTQADRDLIYTGIFNAGTTECIVTGIFTSTYRDYEVELSEVNLSGAANLHLRHYSGASPVGGTGYYGHESNGYSTVAAPVNTISAGVAQWLLHLASGITLVNGKFSIKFCLPAIATGTVFYGEGGGAFTSGGCWMVFGGTHGLATAYDGFGIFPSTGTMSGRVKVYGVR
jgi:hypothetical protein